MSWEEATTVEQLRDPVRPRRYPYTPAEKRRTRSNRFRYFLTVFGALHYSDRVDRPRRIPRRGHIAL